MPETGEQAQSQPAWRRCLVHLQHPETGEQAQSQPAYRRLMVHLQHPQRLPACRRHLVHLQHPQRLGSKLSHSLHAEDAWSISRIPRKKKRKGCRNNIVRNHSIFLATKVDWHLGFYNICIIILLLDTLCNFFLLGFYGTKTSF